MRTSVALIGGIDAVNQRAGTSRNGLGLWYISVDTDIRTGATAAIVNRERRTSGFK